MKEIKELEKSIYKDILMIITIVLVSIPLWLNFDLTYAESVASEYENYNYIDYELLNSPTYYLKPLSDAYAMANLETQDILIYNSSNTASEYNLVLKVNKNTNTANIKINVNYDIQYLDNYERFESGDYYVYIIDADYLKASSCKYVISIWNDENADNSNANLDYLFEVI